MLTREVSHWGITLDSNWYPIGIQLVSNWDRIGTWLLPSGAWLLSCMLRLCPDPYAAAASLRYTTVI
jgi:hypothetical protein